MVLPAAAGPVRTEAIGSAAMVGWTLQASASASAGRIRGGPPAAASGCFGGAAPPQPPPPAVDRSRAAGGSSPSSSPSSVEPPLTPALQLAIANELITGFAMAQEKRALSDGELSLVKFLLDRIPVLEAAAAEACGGDHSPRWGFMVAAPVRLAWLRRRSIEQRAPPSRGPSSSSEEPKTLTPALQLEIAKEVVSRLTSLVKFLEDRIPGLKAASGLCGSGATPSPPKTAVSARARVPAKASRAVAVSSSPVASLCHSGQVAAPSAANVSVGQRVVSSYSGEEDTNATSAVPNNINVSHEHHTGQELSSEPECLSSSSSTKELLSPALQLEIAKEVITRLTMPQEMRMLSADEHSFIKFMKDRIFGLGAAEAASGVCGGEATPPRPNMATSSHACAQSKASHPVAASLSPVPTLLHPLSHQVAMPTAALTVGQQIIAGYTDKEDAHATSRVPDKISEANASHKHHSGKELPSDHESLSSSSPSSSEEPLTPADQLAVANELIARFAMAQEKRMLSDDELSFVKFLLDRIPVLESALGESGGQHSRRRGFMVAPRVQWAWPRGASIAWWAGPCHSPYCSSEEPLTPEIHLEIASEVISHLAMAQERRMLSVGELSLIKFLKDRIPDLEAAASEVRGGATPFPSEVSPSHSRAWALHLAIAAILSPAAANLLHPGLSAPMVHSMSHQDAMPAAHVTVGQQVVNRHLDEEDAHATSVVVNGSSSAPSSSEEPLTPELQLEIAKEVISQLVKAQEKRTLSAEEHSLIKFLKGQILELEADSGVCSGETQSLSKVASSCLLRAKARRVIIATLSAADQRHPGPCAPMVHPLSQQDAKPVARHSGEEDAHATSAIHKMSDANVSHEHHRGGQELSSEHESSEKLNSGCDLGVVTEQSSSTTAPEMAPPPSDGDNTTESSGVSNNWGTAPYTDEFGLPDDLGLY